MPVAYAGILIFKIYLVPILFKIIAVKQVCKIMLKLPFSLGDIQIGGTVINEQWEFVGLWFLDLLLIIKLFYITFL